LEYDVEVFDGVSLRHVYVPVAISILASDDAEAEAFADRIYRRRLVEDNGFFIRCQNEIRNLSLWNLTDDGEVPHDFPKEVRSKKRA
jgi:hypothetical protein